MSIVSFAYKQADFTNRFHPPRFTALFLISTHFLVLNSRFSNKNCSRQIPADYSLFPAVPTIKKSGTTRHRVVPDYIFIS